jgi:hypothetical protein
MVHGIINHGSMCYCNSTVQMLFSIPEFRQFILESDIGDEPFSGLKDIFQKLAAPGSRAVDIKDEFIRLRSNCMIEMDDEDELIETQEDPSEFLLSCIFAKLEFAGLLPSYFKIFKKITPDCNGVQEPSETQENYSLLQINFNAPTIQQNFDESLIETSEIPRCSESYIKKTSFTGTLPKYLLLTLNRTGFDRNRGTAFRKNDPVEINNRLRIPYDGGRNAIYKVKGYISHLGNNPNEGHYYYSAKMEDGVWRRYNDQIVGELPYDEDDGVYLGVSPTEKKRVYVLLYELVELITTVPVAVPVSRPNVPELNRRLANLTLGNVSVPKNKNRNVTRGRKYAKPNAIKRLENRRSVSRNTKNASIRKARYGRLKEFTDENLQGLINRSRAEKGKK